MMVPISLSSPLKVITSSLGEVFSTAPFVGVVATNSSCALALLTPKSVIKQNSAAAMSAVKRVLEPCAWVEIFMVFWSSSPGRQWQGSCCSPVVVTKRKKEQQEDLDGAMPAARH